MKIAILAGGASPEHDVSMASGAEAANALAGRGHSVALCDISQNKTPRFCKKQNISFTIPNAPRTDCGGEKTISKRALRLCKRADICFMALHGGAGERGTVQAILEAENILFTGSDFDGCHLSSDKYVSKLICSDAGLCVPRGVCLGHTDAYPKDVKFPAVIKPCGCGSSVGVSFAESESELYAAIDKAFTLDERVIVEEKITGREFSVSVLGDTALPPVEIRANDGRYGFSEKYGGKATEICPPNIKKEQREALEDAALKAHFALHMRDCSRSDFIIEESCGKIYYLETNALPGLTKNSLFPLEAAKYGINFDALCETLCAFAMERKDK
ncbi:MAG: ATP-grasp domain-containing protein [Clostridiales bacterium]|nr:ATP-grasp domain-containing protein [Clostridiales bacterium]